MPRSTSVPLISSSAPLQHGFPDSERSCDPISIAELAASIRTPLLVVLAWVSLASAVCGQRLHFGVVGGTNLTANFPATDITTPADAFGNPANRFQYLTGPRSLIFGALLEGRLSERFSIEANVLHRPLKRTIIYTEFLPGGVSNVFTNHSTAVRAWEFPVMLKYMLPSLRSDSRMRPFLAAGPSFRTQEDASATEPSQFGVSVGAGAAFYLGKIRVAPTLRYTRWARESIYPRYATKPDQIEFLTSVAYEVEARSLRIAERRIELGAIAGLSSMRGFAQPFSGSIVERTRYLAGLTAEMNVLGNFSVAVNAIYKPLRAGIDFPNDQTPFSFSVLTWQFPVLAKYRWARSTWTPFVEAGPSFRLAGNLNGYNPSHYGVTVGGGVETRARGIRLSPAVRFTHWAKDQPPYPVPAGFDYPWRTNSNAVEVVFGISF